MPAGSQGEKELSLVDRTPHRSIGANRVHGSRCFKDRIASLPGTSSGKHALTTTSKWSKRVALKASAVECTHVISCSRSQRETWAQYSGVRSAMRMERRCMGSKNPAALLPLARARDNGSRTLPIPWVFPSAENPRGGSVRAVWRPNAIPLA